MIPPIELDGVSDAMDPAGQVRPTTIPDLPKGYLYGVARYADVILASAFRGRLDELIGALDAFSPSLDELRAAGGGRTAFVRRFDESLGDRRESGERIWGKQNITIEKRVGFDETTSPISRVRGHEIDMFGMGSLKEPIPGIAVEMEWNNKDPFFDRDLINFQALHREGAIAVGVIVTRGPALQRLITGLVRSGDGGFKYGPSSTHWDKLVPRVNLGGGGECPLLLIGIQPERIAGIELAERAHALMEQADALRVNWRATYARWIDARRAIGALRKEALDLLPVVRASDDTEEDEPTERLF